VSDSPGFRTNYEKLHSKAKDLQEGLSILDELY
jgi:hypothetical protein